MEPGPALAPAQGQFTLWFASSHSTDLAVISCACESNKVASQGSPCSSSGGGSTAEEDSGEATVYDMRGILHWLRQGLPARGSQGRRGREGQELRFGQQSCILPQQSQLFKQICVVPSDNVSQQSKVTWYVPKN